MAKKLTIKERKLVKAKAEGKKHVDAYDAAGYADTTPEAKIVNTSKVLRRPHVQEALEQALVKHGIDMNTAVAPIGEALKDAELEMRLKGSDRALKLMGVGKQEGGVQINFIQHVEEKREKYGL